MPIGPSRFLSYDRTNKQTVRQTESNILFINRLFVLPAVVPRTILGDTLVTISCNKGVFATNSNFLIPISLLADSVNL